MDFEGKALFEAEEVMKRPSQLPLKVIKGDPSYCASDSPDPSGPRSRTNRLACGTNWRHKGRCIHEKGARRWLPPTGLCVQSNLASSKAACLGGGPIGARLSSSCTSQPGDGMIACDTHLNLNSSTASFFVRTRIPKFGQSLLHRPNHLPARTATGPRRTCRSPVISRLGRWHRQQQDERVVSSCALPDQRSSLSCCVSAFTRSLVLIDETHPKALLAAARSASQLDPQLLRIHLTLSTLAERAPSLPNPPPAPTLTSTNHCSAVCGGNLSSDGKTNNELTSWISPPAQFAKMYRRNGCSDSTSAAAIRLRPGVASWSRTPLDSITFDSYPPFASQSLCLLVDKSLSIKQDKSDETQDDLNSICKYLPTSDQAEGAEEEETGALDAADAKSDPPSLGGYQIHSLWPSLPVKTYRRLTNGTAIAWWTRLLFFVMLIYQFQESVDSSANIRAIEKRILDSIIGDGRYDSRIRPSGLNGSVGTRGGDGPAMVYVNLLIRSISRIDDVVMEYSVQVTFREQWVDNRLKFDNMSGQIRYLVLTDPNRVWRPDLFFKNEKEGHFHEIIMPNVLLRIYPEGDVLYSIRISLVLACPMNLKYYPLDKQICSIQMASYGYTTEDLMFVWKKTDPVQITTNLHLPRFTLEKYLTDYCTSKTNTGSYSCLKVDLLFKREFSYYLIQIYIPCCMLVIVSWVSFWLDPNAIPARVSLGVTTLLTMATSISGINSSLPPVSYTKAIDVWTGVCLTFVFGALLEFALVNYASRSDAHRAALKQQQAAFAAQRKWDLEHAQLEADHIDDRGSAFAMRPLVRQHGDFHGEKMRTCEIHVSLPKRNWCKRWLSKFPTRSKRIDVISRIFFPLMFALFNLVYWTTYLFREDMQDL